MEIREAVLDRLNIKLKREEGLRNHRIKCLIEEVEKCRSDEETIEVVYEWERDAMVYRSRGEDEVAFFQQEMFDYVYTVLP